MLVVYWKEGELVFENFALRTRISSDPLVVAILHHCGSWCSPRELSSLLGEYTESSVRKTLKQLSESGVMERSDRKSDTCVLAMEGWSSWNPAAGFFHFSSKDTEFSRDQWGAFEELKKRARKHAMPVPLKKYPRSGPTKLPRTRTGSEFPEILKSRRTWRKYGRDFVSLESLSQVLELTFGIQGWVDLPGLGRAALKTSPSGGALHPIEAYVVAQRVRGLRRGIYHYNGMQHQLEWIRNGMARSALERNLGNQLWFAKGAFFVVMTAVFGRTRWKYQFPRVYRGILIEAGHLSQTFCLTATWLGLAPFCTIAYHDTQWEKWLGIDGVSESVMYIAGAGTRPAPDKMKHAHIGMIGKKTDVRGAQVKVPRDPWLCGQR